MNVEPSILLMYPVIRCWRFRTREDAEECMASMACNTSKALPAMVKNSDGHWVRSPDYEAAPFEVQLRDEREPTIKTR